MKRIFVFLLLLSTASVFAQDVLDKVVAVVDNEIILKSELDFQVSMLVAQRKAKTDTPELRAQLLNSIIEEKLVYAQALIDSINVSEEEVTRQLEYQINTLIQRSGSKEKVEQDYGMTIEKIKRELRDNIKKNALTQRMQEKKFGLIEASRREVEEFFLRFKDSLGVIPEKVKVAHIFKNPATSSELKEKHRVLATQLLDSIKGGMDFAELAKKYSDDPGSAVQGGDLGFVKRGVFFPEFEAAAFALQVGQLSGVVESPVGFHIIQMLERRGESIHTRHILVKIKSDDETDFKVIEALLAIKDSIKEGKGTFAEFAKRHSDDEETAAFGGSLGTLYLEQLDKNLLDATMKLNDGEISAPKRVSYSAGKYGYHIVYLEKRIKQHSADLETDFTDLKRLAEEYKKQQLFVKWIDELKSKIFWEIKS